MAELSGNFLYAAFLVYLIAVPIFGGAIRGRKNKKTGQTGGRRSGLPFRLSVFSATWAILLQGGLPAAMRLSATCLNLQRPLA